MPEGFVYVLINFSMPDMVKIGLTAGETSEVRASRLSASTGVPTKFVVVYDELVADCQEVERRLHARFEPYRVNSRREFFRIPIKTAIQALQEEAQAFALPLAAGTRVELTNEFRRRFGDWLKPDISTVALIQLPGVCLIEITQAPYAHLHDRLIEQLDLDFISEGHDVSYFKPSDPVAVNVRKLLELDDESYFHTLPLFVNFAYEGSDGYDTLISPRGLVNFDASER